jgi:four helix bundle protein
MRNFRKWDVYNYAKQLSVALYQLTNSFPESEKFGLMSQIRRASVSIVANIAEGAGRKTEKDFQHFLYTALGSAFEVEALLDISSELKLIDKASTLEVLALLEIVQKQLNSFIKKLKQ